MGSQTWVSFKSFKMLLAKLERIDGPKTLSGRGVQAAACI